MQASSRVENTSSSWLWVHTAAVAMAVGIFASAWTVANTWERVRTKPHTRTIAVTGSATKRITSDLIEWSASVDVSMPDRAQAYHKLTEQIETTRAFLSKHDIAPEEIHVSSAHVFEQFETQYEGAGDERIQRDVFRGYRVTQTITVSSTNVQKVERASREVTSLLEDGIAVTSESPRYLYTKLGELKIEMLSLASADARARADHIVEAAGQDRIARLGQAHMGVVNINPPNSRESTWDGNNDTSSFEKDIITVVHAVFELGDPP